MIANVTHFLFFFRSDWKLDISWLKTKTKIPIGFQYRTLLQLCYRASGFANYCHFSVSWDGQAIHLENYPPGIGF